MRQTRFPWLPAFLRHCLLLALVLTGVLASAQTSQTYTGDIIAMTITTTGRPTVMVQPSTGGAKVSQYYGSNSWGNVIRVNGTNYTSGYAAGTGLTPVTNTQNNLGGTGGQIVTVTALGATGLQLTQTFSHVTGDRFITKEWTLLNTGGSSQSDIRFFHGGDTYFGGVDDAYGFFDASKSMVYVRNQDYTNWGLMGFYADPATPASYYSEGDFSAVTAQAVAGQLSNAVDSSFQDAGYYLQWNKASLAAGASWTIRAFEVWTPGGPLQMLAPGPQNTLAANTATLPFTVQNLSDTNPMMLTLAATSSQGWTTTITEGTSVTVPISGSMIAHVQVVVPPGATGTNTVTLSATGDQTGSASTILTVVNVSLGISPTSINFGTLDLSASATPQVVTVTNNSGVPVTFGTMAAASPFGITADNLTGVTLADGASATVSVTLATGTAGTYNGTLNIPLTSPALVTQTVSLAAVINNVVNRTVTFQTDGTTGATLTGTTPQTIANGGNATAVSANAPTGYHFVNWTGAGFTTSASNPLTVTNVTQNLTLTANYAINTFTLTYTAGANGTLTGTTPQTVNYNASGSTVTAVPNTGYHFTTWSDGVLTAARTDAAVTGNITVTASFAINTLTIQVSKTGDGQVSPLGTQSVDWGSNTTFTFTPGSGKRVGNVLVDGVPLGPLPSYTFSNIQASHVLSVVFDTAGRLTVAGVPSALGSVAPKQSFVVPGACHLVYITPNRGHHVTDILINGVSLGIATTVYTIPSVNIDSLVTATFAPDEFTITTTGTGNGEVSPAGVQTVAYGLNKVFVFTPNAGGTIQDVLVDGRSVGAVSSYTLLAVQADHTIQVKIAP